MRQRQAALARGSRLRNAANSHVRRTGCRPPRAGGKQLRSNRAERRGATRRRRAERGGAQRDRRARQRWRRAAAAVRARRKIRAAYARSCDRHAQVIAHRSGRRRCRALTGESGASAVSAARLSSAVCEVASKASRHTWPWKPTHGAANTTRRRAHGRLRAAARLRVPQTRARAGLDATPLASSRIGTVLKVSLRAADLQAGTRYAMLRPACSSSQS